MSKIFTVTPGQYCYGLQTTGLIMFRLKRTSLAALSLFFILLLLASTALKASEGADISLKSMQADITITGTVKSESGDILPGVSVNIKGTKLTVGTNSQGVYTIKVPNQEAVLVFNYVGYHPAEMPVGNKKTLNVIMKQNTATLEEVQVINVGYGTVSKERLAGAVSSIKAKDLVDFPVSSLAEALAGKLAGVAVNATEGAPGANINVTVRGGTSITQDNSPLFIVDGFPMDNALNVINPNEVASIDVLKDVASTSIYGSRGANGVFLITTKSGRRGRTVISFDTYAGVRKITNFLDMMHPYDYVLAQYAQNIQHYNGALNDSTSINGLKRTYGNYSDFDIYKSVPTVNWQSRVFGRDAFSNTQSLNLNGGNSNSIYNFVFNRSVEDGIMLASGLNRTFASFRFENQVTSRLKMGVNARYSNQLIVGAGTSAKGSNNSIGNSARFQPYDAVSNLESNDPDANFDTAIDLSTPTTGATRDMARGVSKQFIGRGFVSFNILPSLTIRSNLGYNITTNDNKSFRGVTNYRVTSLNNLNTYTGYPFVDLNKGNVTVINNSNVLSYSKTFKKDHRLEIVLGQELNKYDNDSFTQNIQWFPSAVTWQSAFANIQQANPPPGSIQNPSTTNVGGERLFSFFGRAMYSYKSRYNLNLSFRRDGSSKFSPDNRWSNFPSAQFAWRVSEEKFYQNLDLSWMNNLKLRFSYGTAGNNRVNGDRLYTTVFLTSPTAGGYAQSDNSQTSGVHPTALANPNLRWETTVSKNIGLDFDLFKSRLTASIDIYANDTKNLLLNTNIPQQTGYTTQFQNIGSTRNKGLEIQLTGDVIKSANFSYNAALNISFNRNTVRSLNQGGQATYGYAVSSGWGATEEDFYVAVGQPVGMFYGYVYDGFYTVNDFDRTAYETELAASGKQKWVLKPGVADNTAKYGQVVAPGKVKLKDLDGDGVITNNDKTILGYYQPKFIGGFNNQFRYKAFDLSIFMNFSYGNKTYNATKSVLSTSYQVNGNNYPAEFVDGYKYFDTEGKLVTNLDQLNALNADTKLFAPRYGMMLPTSYGVEDASFLRITNVTFGYSLPPKILAKVPWISRFRVYATVNNLYTFTNYKGFDPEASTRGTALTPGVDYSAYPRSRYILAGINLSF